MLHLAQERQARSPIGGSTADGTKVVLTCEHRAVNIGTVDIYANHSFVFLGPDDWPELDWDDEPASCDGRHLVVRTRGQFGHARVSLWRGAMPVIGECVYQGTLTIEKQRIWIEDLERLNRYVKQIGLTGPQPITVYADDPGYASRVHFGLGLGAVPHRVPMTAVDGHPLPEILVSPEEPLVQINELGLIFDDFDSPLARLAGALKLISRPRPDARSFPDDYELNTMMAEWLRRLAWNLPLERSRQLCLGARDQIAAKQPIEGTFALSDEAALTLASDILGRI